ncbi:claudin-like protein ZF-A9 [Conger conger]|uniref:claudin-like protein ZF-A9 n=1 Tax=Conger conger TaxID=82655 RepID=UPI002A59C6C0|nr:claudin-like protein ZF-A9 [Conger conger]
MAKMAVQLLGFFLGLLGMLGTIVATLLPYWRRTAYIGSNIITATGAMTGLWMECVWHSTGIYQCQLHRSLLALSPDLQAARALMVLSCFASAFGIGVSAVGMKCTRLAQRFPAKNAMAMGGGLCFAASGLLCLVTVSWTTNDVVRDFHNPLLPGSRYEIGQAVYLGFFSAFLSLAGGATLCLPLGNSPGRPPYRPPPPNALRRPAPPHRPPPAFKSNHLPARHSASSDGYRLSGYV